MLNIQKPNPKPPRIFIYGPQGLGKSTFGSLAENPIFLQTEDGLDALDVASFPLSKTYGEVMGNLSQLADEEHDFKTLVVDSLDWLEPLIWQQVIAENPTNSNGKTVRSIEDYGYGKGYALALDLWREYLQAINFLREERQMTIIQTAHAEIKRFENPTTDAYDRYQPKLQRSAAALLLEHSDVVLFTNYYVGVTKENTGFSDRKRAIGSGDRVLYTEERPSFIAKSRYSLPEEIPFDKNGDYWNVIANAVPYFNK
jgi:hypothetical protein